MISDRAAIDTLVVGAGPYGLSVSAHLKRAGVAHKLVGRTMDSWRGMPRGMCLRSPVAASSLSDPDRVLTVAAFWSKRGEAVPSPLPLESFLEYGDWFAERAGLEVDPRLVRELTTGDGVFSALLEDGERVRARRVVVAAGHKSFQWAPAEFRGLPPEFVSHTGDHDDFGDFAGKDVVVVGAGQSGIECAALARERGAAVRVVLRGQGVNWLTRSARLHRSWLRPLLYSWSDVGPAGLSRIVAAPGILRMVPSAPRQRATSRCTRPAAAAWLVSRAEQIPIETRCQIREVTLAAGRVRVGCEDGRVFDADHVLLATGYRVELARYAFIAPELRSAVKTVRGSPVLGRGLESSVPGLHIVGMPAAWSYGPLARFVAGAHFSARAITARLLAAPSVGHQLTSADVQPASAA